MFPVDLTHLDDLLNKQLWQAPFETGCLIELVTGYGVTATEKHDEVSPKAKERYEELKEASSNCNDKAIIVSLLKINLEI